MATKQTKRERELAAEIRAMNALAKEAQQRGSFSAAVAARSKVSALRTEHARLSAERLAEAEDDPVVRIQRLCRMATEAGSYVAAAALAKQEQALVDARDAAALAAQGDGFEGMTDEGLVGVIEGAILALPDTLVLRLREAADARLEGRRLRVVGGTDGEG